jgi:glycosyltransferase involved in cell wall biosynthesis
MAAGWFKRRPRLKHQFLPCWRRQVANLLEEVDACVTTSEYAKDLYCRYYPALASLPFHVIEHGRDFSGNTVLQPVLTNPARIVVPGSLSDVKGLHLINDLSAILDRREIELHVLGTTSEGLHPNITYHGAYKRNELAAKLRAISPSLAMIPTIGIETYCHVLTEVWERGLPVAVTDRGTLKERMEKTGAGWLLDISSAEKMADQLRKIVNDPDGYQRACRNLAKVQIRSVDEMAQDYERLYSQLLSSRDKSRTIEEGIRVQDMLRAQKTALQASKGQLWQGYNSKNILRRPPLKTLRRRTWRNVYSYFMLHIIKPTLKRHNLTHRFGLWVREVYRRNFKRP